uniref:G-protein coupled receptors family 2 profile 2 domain-containing protein n=1 Tax=Poecilia latipinna TaxID=48699 RepID=A0A3B3VNY7_9TELE
MLASALLLLYRTVFVFEGGLSKTSMLVIGFVLGYAAPLVIAVTTMAVTVPSHKYIRENHGCWLNWEDSKALLAFLAPALMIVAINFLILLVVIYKMVSRRGVRNTGQGKEQHVLVVIARSLAVLTPFFGLTWSLGIGTIIAPKNKEVNFAFVFFNSLQVTIFKIALLLTICSSSRVASFGCLEHSWTKRSSSVIVLTIFIAPHFLTFHLVYWIPRL